MGRGFVLLILLAACGRQLVAVVPSRPTSAAATSDPTFEVVTRLSGARDPLPVGDTEVSYAELAGALGEAVVRELAPRHDSVLSVELVAAEARYRERRLDVSLVVRATLRTRVGNAFIAQTTIVCRDGAIIDPSHGVRVMWSCMTRIGHDLGGWLAAQPPNPSPEAP